MDFCYRYSRVSFLPVNGAHLESCCLTPARGKSDVRRRRYRNQEVLRKIFCHCVVSEYCHVCDAITCTYIGKCALTVDRGDEADAGILLASCRRKTQFSFKRTSQRQISKKYRTEWCVCVLTARGLDMRSKDWRMRLAVALVTPQG